MKSKIYDCFMFNNEIDLLNIRLNILNQYVDYFVIIESAETHSGIKKKLGFDIEKFSEFRNKIIYGVIEKFPENFSAWEKENYQRNYIAQFLNKADDDDFIIISDLDEIPNLENINLENLNEKIIVFQQRLFFYKLNFGELIPSWHGSRCIKKKNLKNPQWLRNLKTYKKYKFFRLDKIYFSTNYEHNFRVIENGGWHFTWMGDIKFIKNKLKSFAHTELNKLEINNDEFLGNCIKNMKPLEQKQKLELRKLSLNKDFMPEYILKNLKKYKHMLSGEM
tara:strand:- start:523 stop:1356 length:834 start_codon:yes stop_codon:yes gene_type:complete